MKQLFQTKWLALALCLCAPMATWAENHGDGTEDSPFDLSQDDVTLPDLTADATYYITGDASESGYTIKFPTTASSDYAYTLFLTNVKIKKSAAAETPDESKQLRALKYTYSLATASVDNCGLYIPDGTSVTIYLTGNNSFEGSEYGIYAGTGTTWSLNPVGVTDAEGDNEQTDITTTTIDITGNYGIVDMSENGFNIQGTKLYNGNYSADGNDFLGKITINAVQCGIYAPYAVNIDGTNLNINVTGEGSVSTNSNTSDAGYIIYDLVCGIYASHGMGQTDKGINMAVVNLTLVASGTYSYGMFLDNADSTCKCYMGDGTYRITAGWCVMHHEQEYACYIWSSADNPTVVIPKGPFCSHYQGYWEDEDHYWYCDNGNSTTGIDGIYIIEDGDNMDDFYYDYNINYKTEVDEVEYVGRNLYAGWNTLCLPYDYKVNASSEEDTRFYQYEEAREAIDAYAEYDSSNDDTYGEGATTITFKILDTTSEDFVLEHDKAYLVWIDDTGHDYDYHKTVQFTAMETNLEVVGNRSGDEEIFFDPVFDKEVMTGTTLDGETSGHTHYKLTAHNQYKSTNPEDTEVYIDKGDEGLYTDTEKYTLTGVANFFNGTSTATTFYPYRCYIDVDERKSEELAKQLTIVFDNGETTGIDRLNGKTLNDGNSVVNVYSIDGKLVKTAIEKTATNGLSKGVYVVNGKKVVVM